jgi:hypothetical protein
MEKGRPQKFYFSEVPNKTSIYYTDVSWKVDSKK